MKPIMNINDLNTIEQLEQFLTDSQAVAFLFASRAIVCTIADYGTNLTNKCITVGIYAGMWKPEKRHAMLSKFNISAPKK